MKKKIIKSAKDMDDLEEGELGVVREGALKWEIATEEPAKPKQKSRA